MAAASSQADPALVDAYLRKVLAVALRKEQVTSGANPPVVLLENLAQAGPSQQVAFLLSKTRLLDTPLLGH